MLPGGPRGGEQRLLGAVQHRSAERGGGVVPVGRQSLRGRKRDVERVLHHPDRLDLAQVVGVLPDARRHRGNTRPLEKHPVDGGHQECRVEGDAHQVPTDGERGQLRHRRAQVVGVEQRLHGVEPLQPSQLSHPRPIDVSDVGEVSVRDRGGSDLRLQAVEVDRRPFHCDAGGLGELCQRCGRWRGKEIRHRDGDSAGSCRSRRSGARGQHRRQRACRGGE